MNTTNTAVALRQKQSLPLEAKVIMSSLRIRQWFDHWICADGVYVSFSGGKDSTVLLHLAREALPHRDIVGVFCDTGLEYPEVRDFVRSVDNVVWIKPAMGFREVIERYGYPVINKEQASYIYDYRTTNSEKLRHLRWHGRSGKGSTSPGRNRYKISEKWKYLVDAPFKISEKCCDVLKKRPFARYEKTTGAKMMLGTMASDSNQRRMQYIRHGCNAFNTSRPRSTPLFAWTDQDIWDYIRTRNLPYSPIYDMGYTHTGCMFCLFGYHQDGEKTRFERMKETHSRQYRYCMDVLGLEKVIEWLEKNGNEF